MPLRGSVEVSALQTGPWVSSARPASLAPSRGMVMGSAGRGSPQPATERRAGPPCSRSITATERAFRARPISPAAVWSSAVASPEPEPNTERLSWFTASRSATRRCASANRRAFSTATPRWAATAERSWTSPGA